MSPVRSAPRCGSAYSGRFFMSLYFTILAAMKLEPKQYIELLLESLHKEGTIPPFVIDKIKVDAARKFRFDWAIPDLKLAIEYEGISGKSRHTSITGYTRDCTKYNLAAKNGWRVLRYTVLNYKELEADLLSITHGNSTST